MGSAVAELLGDIASLAGLLAVVFEREDQAQHFFGVAISDDPESELDGESETFAARTSFAPTLRVVSI